MNAHLLAVLSSFVRTKLITYNIRASSSSVSVTSSLSSASTGLIVLNGVWFRKNTVQSAGCLSAPSGSMRLARRLTVLVTQCVGICYTRRACLPFIRSERLRELVCQLRATVDIEVGHENERAVLRVVRHGISAADNIEQRERWSASIPGERGSDGWD